jgi:hypothetical protein
MTSASPAAHVDRIRADYRDGLITRPDAIAEIRSCLDLTELGGGLTSSTAHVSLTGLSLRRAARRSDPLTAPPLIHAARSPTWIHQTPRNAPGVAPSHPLAQARYTVTTGCPQAAAACVSSSAGAGVALARRWVVVVISSPYRR